MDKFLTFPGQQPIYLGDIDFMQTAVGAALKNLLISYTGNADGSAILAGVEIIKTETDVSWSEGVLAIGGDIMPVSAGSISGAANSTLYFQVISTLSGSRTMKDGTVRQCWQTKSATIVTSETDYPVSNFGRAGTGQQASIYKFDNYPLSGYDYALLANCGGAWIFSFRKTATDGTSKRVFSDTVSDLPDAIREKLGNEIVPVLNHFVANIYIDPRVSGATAPYAYPVVIDTSNTGDKLGVVVYSVDIVPANQVISGTIIIPRF